MYIVVKQLQFLESVNMTFYGSKKPILTMDLASFTIVIDFLGSVKNSYRPLQKMRAAYNILHVLKSKKTKGPVQDSQNWLRSHLVIYLKEENLKFY
jgi:hypothetical protein